MIDRVDNETKKARLLLSQSNSKESEGNNTSQRGTFESAHGKYVHVVAANKQLERIRIPKFSGGKMNISRGGQRFPDVWMKQICQFSLKCCCLKVV